MGIGIYLKAAHALFVGGPVAMVLAYLWVGTVAYSMTVNPDMLRLIKGLYWRNDICSSNSWSPFRHTEPNVVTCYRNLNFSAIKLNDRGLRADGPSGSGISSYLFKLT